MRVCPTVVLCVCLVEALRVDEAKPIKTRVHRGRAVGLIRHQSIVPVTHQAIHLQTHSIQPDALVNNQEAFLSNQMCANNSAIKIKIHHL